MSEERRGGLGVLFMDSHHDLQNDEDGGDDECGGGDDDGVGDGDGDGDNDGDVEIVGKCAHAASGGFALSD